MAELSYPVALGLTLTIEVPVYVAALSGFGGASRRRSAAIGVLVNVVSHPTLWFVLVPLIRRASGSHEVAVAAAEAVVWWGEGIAAALLLPQHRRWPAAIGTAMVANALSFGIGLALFG